MGHLFLDIETYASENDPQSAFNPYKAESKVILIAYSYYDSFKPPVENEIRAPIFLKEWESSEREILQKFYDFLKELQKKDQHLKITGFNVVKFDLTYLFGRMKVYNLASEDELHELLFNKPYSIDLMQLSTIISEETRKYEQPWSINQKKASEFFGLQAKEGTGKDCSKFYDQKEYDKIIRYCTQEFNFEQLLDCFYLYLIEKKGTNDSF